VHETGARTTHDIKNLLQSLNVLCSVAAREDYRDWAQLQGLVRRQLPMVAQRLAETLERLQRPRPESETTSGEGWWDALARQYRGEGVDFQGAEPPPRRALPRPLFDSVADNLIGNALVKRSSERDTRVQVALEYGERVALRVCDTAAPFRPRSRRACCARR
jgi:hypothetical protein